MHALREELGRLSSLGEHHRRLLARLTLIVLATAAVDLLAAIAMYLLERHTKGTELKTFGQAAFFTTVQLLTVSSQIKNPLTAPGRLIDVALELWAVIVVAGSAGAIATLLPELRLRLMDSGRVDAAPAIADHAFLSDRRTACLVSRAGTVDWWCVPRIDSGSCFAAPARPRSRRPHAPRSDGRARRRGGSTCPARSSCARRCGREPARSTLTDLLALARDGTADGGGHLVRHRRGPPRQRPHARRDRPALRLRRGAAVDPPRGADRHVAIGGNDALVIWSDAPLEPTGDHDAAGDVHAHGRASAPRSRCATCRRTSSTADRAEIDLERLDALVERTARWWRRWAAPRACRADGARARRVLRSALVLKGLASSATGAIVAAATTSLPEVEGGSRNWDYRYSLDPRLDPRRARARRARLRRRGRRVPRASSSAARPGTWTTSRSPTASGGERRLDRVRGRRWRATAARRPVRVGNAAAVAAPERRARRARAARVALAPARPLARRRHVAVHLRSGRRRRRALGRAPTPGIWEQRGDARPLRPLEGHVLGGARPRARARRRVHAPRRRCGAGSAIATASPAPSTGTATTAGGARSGARSGRRRSTPRCCSSPTPASPTWPTSAWPAPSRRSWPTSARTACCAATRRRDDLPGREAPFVACTFWLAECLAGQGRLDDAVRAFERATATANDLGLYSEEYDPGRTAHAGQLPPGADAPLAHRRGDVDRPAWRHRRT